MLEAWLGVMSFHQNKTKQTQQKTKTKKTEECLWEEYPGLDLFQGGGHGGGGGGHKLESY